MTPSWFRSTPEDAELAPQNKPLDAGLEEERVIESFLECGPKLLFILLPVKKARQFQAAVADQDCVTVYDINLKFSLVKWAATYDEFEKVDILIPIIIRRRNHGMVFQGPEALDLLHESDSGSGAGSGSEGAEEASYYPAAGYSVVRRTSQGDSLVRRRDECGRPPIYPAPGRAPLVGSAGRPAKERRPAVKKFRSTNTPAAGSENRLVGALSRLRNCKVPVYMVPLSAFLGGLVVWAFLSCSLSGTSPRSVVHC